MLRMRRLIPFVIVLPLCFSACSSKPRAINDDVSVIQLREDYLNKHPSGKYNPYIAKGEVVRGMDFVEVSASWGLPETRWKSKDEKYEYWTFFGADELSGDWSRYTLVFEETVLTDWLLDRHFIKNGALTRWGFLGDGSNRPPDERASAKDAGSSKP